MSDSGRDVGPGRWDLASDRGDADEGDLHLRRSLSYVEGRPASRSKAYVLARVAGRFMTGIQPQEAIPVGEEALRMAEELDDVELRCDVLNTIASARLTLGDDSGLTALEESIEIAHEAGLPYHEARGYVNLASVLVESGDLSRVSQLYDEGARAATRAGSVHFGRWIQAEQAGIAYLEGRWDAAVALCDRFVDESERAPHYQEAECRFVRGVILNARGESKAGSADLRYAVELARLEKDPQALYPALSYAGHSLIDAGAESEGVRLAEEALALWRESGCLLPPGTWAVPLAFALAGTPELVDALERAPVSPRWLDAAKAIAVTDFAVAADVLAKIGSVADEAYARLRAVEVTRDESQLERALAFYRGVDATAYLRRAEAVLVPSA